MLKTSLKSCINCGSKQNLQEHHISYKPEIKVWMCTKCHNLEHPGHGVGRAIGFKMPMSYRIIEGKPKFIRKHHLHFSYIYECIKDDGKTVRVFTHKRTLAQTSSIMGGSSSR